MYSGSRWENPSTLPCWNSCSSCFRCEDKGRYSKCNHCSGRHDPDVKRDPYDVDDRCLLPGTLISMEDGTFFPIEEVCTGDLVHTHKGTGKVGKVLRRSYNGAIYGIRAAKAMNPLWLTEGHNVWVRHANSDNWHYLPVEEVSPGDWVLRSLPEHRVEAGKLDLEEVLPDYFVSFEGEMRSVIRRNTCFALALTGMPRFVEKSPELFALIGYYVAEGCLVYGSKTKRSTKVKFTFHKEERSYIDEVVSLCGALGLRDVHVNPRPNQNVTDVIVSNHTFAHLMEALVGAGSRDKRLSSFIMNSDPSLLEELLRTWINGDGSNPYHHPKQSIVSTASVNLAYQGQLIVSCIQPDNISSVNSFENNQGPGNRGGKNRIYTFNKTSESRNILETEGGIALKVVEILKKPYYGYVHNFEVLEHEAYVAQGVALSNCRCTEGVLQYRLQTGKMIQRKFLSNPFRGSVETDAETPDERDWRQYVTEQREKLDDETFDPVTLDDGTSTLDLIDEQRRG